jgi:hypothetical protein
MGFQNSAKHIRLLDASGMRYFCLRACETPKVITIHNEKVCFTVIICKRIGGILLRGFPRRQGVINYTVTCKYNDVVYMYGLILSVLRLSTCLRTISQEDNNDSSSDLA